MPEHIRTGRCEYSRPSGSLHDGHLQLRVLRSRRDACKASILHRGESDQPKNTLIVIKKITHTLTTKQLWCLTVLHSQIIWKKILQNNHSPQVTIQSTTVWSFSTSLQGDCQSIIGGLLPVLYLSHIIILKFDFNLHFNYTEYSVH